MFIELFQLIAASSCGPAASCLALQFEEIFGNIERQEHSVTPAWRTSSSLIQTLTCLSLRGAPKPHLQDVWCLRQSLFIGVSVHF